MEHYRFEEIKEEHIPFVLDIYNHYVLHTTATFHVRPLTQNEMKEIVFFKDERYKAFAIKERDKICGYIILSRYKNREAYDCTAEVTVYLHPEYVGKGIGSLGVAYIEDIARNRGFHSLIAGICGENKQSIRLFEKNGYQKCAHYREAGKKFGRFLDVVEYQKILS